VGRVDTRLLVLIGVTMNVISLYLLRFVNLDVGFHYLLWSRLCQGFGLGFLFVPIATSAYARISPQQMGQATGLFNLLRNEGGSVGIALATTFLTQRAQFHQNSLVEHLTPYDPAYQQSLANLARGIFPYSGLDPVSNKGLAQGLVYGLLQRQAYALAFVDVFFLLMLVFCCFLPFILLLRGRPHRASEGH
jgi:MFS transporter, DHA2 family, multidrug resistance protein